MVSNIVERLRCCRKRSRISLRTLEETTGKTYGHLGHVHNGKKAAKLELLQRLAPIYRTTVAWLEHGDPVVDIWHEFQESVLCKAVSDSTASPAERTAAVLNYLNDHYSGHLRYDDVAYHLGLSTAVVQRLRNGQAPTPELAQELQRLTGVPANWLELGNYAPFSSLDLVQGMSVAELQSLLVLGQKAKASGLTIDQLHKILEAIGTGRA